MSYSPRRQETDDRYEFRQENPTISQLVHPSDERQASDNRYTVDSRRTGGSSYESIRQESDRRNDRSEYTRRAVPTADVTIDPYRRPTHGNARTCIMEINIAVGLGPDRTPHASVITNSFPSKPPAIRSTAVIDDVRYVDLNFQVPDNSARLATDGIIRQVSPRNSIGYQNKNTDE